jgi:hypothetical protein
MKEYGSRRITLVWSSRMSKTLAPKAKVAAAYVVCALVWGTTWFAIRVSIGPGAYPTYEAAALRFSLAVVMIGVLGLAGIVSMKLQPGRELGWLCAAGFVNSRCYGLLYAGEESIPGSTQLHAKRKARTKRPAPSLIQLPSLLLAPRTGSATVGGSAA